MTDDPVRRDPFRAEPDRAALDELLRAFGGPVGDATAPTRTPGDTDDVIDDDVTDDDVTDDDIRDGEDADDVTDGGRDEPAAAPATDGSTADDAAIDHLLDESTARGDRAVATPPEGADDGAGDGAGEGGDPGDATQPAPPPSKPAVIAIADDDLPDPVYVQGTLDDDSGRSVVFIDDDDIGDAVVPDASGTLGRGIEPRFRERRIAVRRAEGRRRLRWFVVVGAIVAVLVAGLAVLGSPLFSVEEITVTGAVYTDAARLQEIVDDLEGTPVLLVDTADVERRIEAIPWVDEARVRTDFPRRVSIEIDEREALAAFQGPDGRFRVIDRDGRVLDVLDGQPIAYMLVTGPDAADLEPGTFAAPGYSAAAELVQGLTGSVRGRVTSIDVTADGSQLRMFLDDGLEVRFGAANDLLTKLVRLETVLASATELGARLIDVSTAEVTIR